MTEKSQKVNSTLALRERGRGEGAKYAFTLAEVLITLGIIGVVAAMTLPSIIEDYREKETVVKVKKVYSMLQNIYLQVANEHGHASTWECPGSAGMTDAYSRLWSGYFISKMTNVQRCTKENFYKQCFNNKIYSLYAGSASLSSSLREDWADFAVRMADGGALLFVQNTPSGMSIFYDVNGAKAPNTYGKDVFVFSLYCAGGKSSYVSLDKVMPLGFELFKPIYRYPSGYCNTRTTERRCTAWVVFEGNMDYLHCNDLSTQGKTKCSK